MKLALGTAQFGMDYGINSIDGRVKASEVTDILNYACKNGIGLLDTAPSYGNSEHVLGNANVKDFQIVTKTRHFNQTVITNKEVDLLNDDLGQSLKSLKHESLYGLLVHNVDDLLKPGADKLFNQLMYFRQQGLVSKIGVSVYTGDKIQNIVDKFDIDLIQLPFNIIDRRLIDGGILKMLKKLGIEVHARSIFLQGLLLMTDDRRPSQFSRWNSLWGVWYQWLNDNNITALEATIRYASSIPEISKILVGVDTKTQLQDIVQATKGDLPVVPKDLFTNDSDLLNPVNWTKL